MLKKFGVWQATSKGHPCSDINQEEKLSGLPRIRARQTRAHRANELVGSYYVNDYNTLSLRIELEFSPHIPPGNKPLDDDDTLPRSQCFEVAQLHPSSCFTESANPSKLMSVKQQWERE